MLNCPECDAVIDVEEDELDAGDALTCDECGATLSVVSLNPIELEVADDDEDEEDDEDLDYDEDEEDEDEDEEDDEEDEWK